jgi:hypothetical protein
MLLLISEGGGATISGFLKKNWLLLKKEPFDWPTINIFGTMGTLPNIEA